MDLFYPRALSYLVPHARDVVDLLLDPYLWSESYETHHDEEEDGPELWDGHGGQTFRVDDEHQAGTWGTGKGYILNITPQNVRQVIISIRRKLGISSVEAQWQSWLASYWDLTWGSYSFVIVYCIQRCSKIKMQWRYIDQGNAILVGTYNSCTL